MPLRWDALLARHTAAELAQALTGQRVTITVNGNNFVINHIGYYLNIKI
jgi:hypothetical protein